MAQQAYSLDVKVAGVWLRFRSDLEVDICHLRLLFKHHLVATPPPPGEPDGDMQHTIEIKTVTQRVVPQGARQVWQGFYHGVGHAGKHENTVRKYVDPDGSREYFETADGECIICEPARHHTTCALLSRRRLLHAGRVRSNVGSVIILLVHIVLASHRRYTLHAAAVEWKGRAIVFAGRSGQGKSTLCTDLVAQGAGFLGDDIVFIYLHDGQPSIASLLFDAKLFEDSQTTKTFVDIVERHHCPVLESVPLQAIAEIRQTRRGRSAVSVQADDDRLFDVLLEAANNIALQYDRADWLSLCTHVLQDYRLYTVDFGDRTLLDTNILNDFYGQE